MLSPQFLLPIYRELVVDLFAGGGGASTGIEQAIGRPVDVAINHDPEAISLHTANHPQTIHYTADVFEVDPLEATEGRPVGLLWASPSCTHFSRARGGVPVSKQLRSLGWVVVRWAAAVRPRVIEAGCFGGSLDEFCEKAGREGKTRYVRVVRAAAEALQADVIDKGSTGGWDEEKSK